MVMVMSKYDAERDIDTVEVINTEYWDEIRKRNELIKSIAERRNKDYDWFDSCKPDEHD